MKELMTKHFSKWASKQNIPANELFNALNEIQNGKFEANLGGNVYKKRIRFKGQGKSGSGRTILCYRKGKNETSNITKKELLVFKELSKILLSFDETQIATAVKNGVLIEVKP